MLWDGLPGRQITCRLRITCTITVVLEGSQEGKPEGQETTEETPPGDPPRDPPGDPPEEQERGSPEEGARRPPRRAGEGGLLSLRVSGDLFLKIQCDAET